MYIYGQSLLHSYETKFWQEWPVISLRLEGDLFPSCKDHCLQVNFKKTSKKLLILYVCSLTSMGAILSFWFRNFHYKKTQLSLFGNVPLPKYNFSTHKGLFQIKTGLFTSSQQYTINIKQISWRLLRRAGVFHQIKDYPRLLSRTAIQTRSVKWRHPYEVLHSWLWSYVTMDKCGP